MTTEQAIQLLTALFTGLSIIYLARQVRQQRKATEADTFLSVVNTAREICLSERMDIIRAIPDEAQDFTAEQEEAIRVVLDFFNDIMHLIHADHLPLQTVLRIYYVPIMYCHYKIRPTWLVNFRAKHGDVPFYRRFEELCDIAKNISFDNPKLWNTRDFLQEWQLQDIDLWQYKTFQPIKTLPEWQDGFAAAYRDKTGSKQ